MKVDVLFLDIACSKSYNYESLENDSLGGTECSTIRLAEGFASKGLSVAIVQKFDFPAYESPNGVIYAPFNWLNQIHPKNVIHLRFRGFINKFPYSKNFLWFHDAAMENHNNPKDWSLPMINHKTQGICVSDWHKTNLLSFAPDMPLQRIYSPVDEYCYTTLKPDKIDNNQLVWMSSPHKGLSEALEIFKELYRREPKMKLVVFNPGYYTEEIKTTPGVVVAPAVKRAALRSVLKQSLCLFYPTKFEETFGLVATEANALGTPVASYGVAALAESAADKPFSTSNELIEGVLKWRENRPKTTGQDRFRFETIWNDWSKLLDF